MKTVSQAGLFMTIYAFLDGQTFWPKKSQEPAITVTVFVQFCQAAICRDLLRGPLSRHSGTEHAIYGPTQF